MMKTYHEQMHLRRSRVARALARQFISLAGEGRPYGSGRKIINLNNQMTPARKSALSRFETFLS
jgi:hypothetical protein